MKAWVIKGCRNQIGRLLGSPWICWNTYDSASPLARVVSRSASPVAGRPVATRDGDRVTIGQRLPDPPPARVPAGDRPPLTPLGSLHGSGGAATVKGRVRISHRTVGGVSNAHRQQGSTERPG